MVSDRLMKKYLTQMPNEPSSLRTLAKKFNLADSNVRRIMVALEGLGLVEEVVFDHTQNGRVRSCKGYKKIALIK